MNSLRTASNTLTVLAIALLASIPLQGLCSDWSNTDLMYQYGKLDTPNFAGGGKSNTTIITLQHASGWAYGDNFFFVDYLDDDNDDNFNNRDFYGEAYFNFSLGKMFNSDLSYGPLKDIGLILGINAAADANVMKYLPGVRFSWDIPGFAFINSDFTAYIDDNQGLSNTSNNAPTEQDSYMIDVSWNYPFSIGDYSLSVGGHMEYIGRRQNEFGNEVKGWFLAQPQLRLDLGKQLLNRENTLFVGIKWQYWLNKLGEDNTDENALMAVVTWRL